MTKVEATLFYTSFIGGLLSLFGTTIVIAAALYIEPTSNTRTNLVFCMMTVQWLRAFMVVSGSIIELNQDLEDFSPGAGCTLNGFFIEQTLIAGDITNLYIGIFTWVAFACANKFERFYNYLEGHFTFLFMFPWVFSSIIAIIAGISPGYVPLGSNWCFIAKTDKNLWRWIYAWSPRIIISIIMVILYGHILFIVLKSRQVLQETSLKDQEESQKLNKAARKLFLYPIVYVIWRLPGIIGRIKSTPEWDFLHAFAQNVGLVDALVYGYSEDLKSRFFKKWNDDPGATSNVSSPYGSTYNDHYIESDYFIEDKD